MVEHSSFFLLGGLFIFFELLFGLPTELDLLFVGTSLVMGGISQFIFSNFLLEVLAFIISYGMYLLFIRRFLKKKIYIFLQHIGIDAVVGKGGVVTHKLTTNQKGTALVDGELWIAVADKAINEGDKIIVEELRKNVIVVSLERDEGIDKYS